MRINGIECDSDHKIFKCFFLSSDCSTSTNEIKGNNGKSKTNKNQQIIYGPLRGQRHPHENRSDDKTGISKNREKGEMV